MGERIATRARWHHQAHAARGRLGPHLGVAQPQPERQPGPPQANRAAGRSLEVGPESKRDALSAIFEVFDRPRTVVDVVTTAEVSVSLSLDDASELDAIVAELELLGTVSVETERAMICVVGAGLRGTPGIAARVFSTISDINVMLISQGSSSINLTFVIEERQLSEAVSRLHMTFFEARDAEPATIRVPSRKRSKQNMNLLR